MLDYQTGLGIVTTPGTAPPAIIGFQITGALAVGVTVIKLATGYVSINTLSDTSNQTGNVPCPTCGNTTTTPHPPNAGGFTAQHGLWREFEAY